MPEPELLLIIAGLAGGFAAGLIGIGGGIIFAPVLLLYFQSAGVQDVFVTPLAIGTSLLCTVLTSVVSSWSHHRKGAVNLRVALTTGAASALAVYLTTTFVTTQPWYDQREFGLAFSVVLLVVAAQMLFERIGSGDGEAAFGTTAAAKPPIGTLAATGTVAGAVSSAVGVGGGIVLVPAYNRLLGLPIHVAVGTSSATIIVIAIFGVASYVAGGYGSSPTEFAVGFVDPIRAAYLAIPALFSARAGAWTAHRTNKRRLQQGFAVFAVLVALRIIIDTVIGW